jgi:rhamnulokinase
MATTRVLAIDFGASGGKCFAGLFEDGSFSMREVHRFAHENIPFHLPDRTGALVERRYWDDTFLYQNILLGLHAYRRQIGPELDAIGIDTWGSDGQFITADGDLLGKVYAYRDHRLDHMVERVKKRISPKKIYALTGIHFQPFNISNQIHWFVLNRKDLLRKDSRFLPIPALFNFYLGGVCKIDSSWASVTQLMDARLRTWSPEILKKLKIPAEVMPEIVAPGTVIGQLHAPIAEEAGIQPARLIAVGSHDTASAYAAAPVDNPDEALIISSGTWSLVGKLVPEPVTSPAAMAMNLSNEGGIGNIRLLKNCMGGWLVQELRRVWRNADGEETAWKELDALTHTAPPFQIFINPDDPSFYNPTNMQTAIDEYCRRTGQPQPSDRGLYLRSIYESLALTYRRVNEQICKACGKTTRKIHIVGGGSRNILLNQFTANALGLPVIAGPEEATAVGNIMVQALGLGLINSLTEAQPIIRRAFPITDYQPRDTAAWDRAYARFKVITGVSG